MLFGIPEIKEYEKTCTDPYVLAIIKKLWEARSNAAKWNNGYVKLNLENKKLKDDIEELEFQYRQSEDKLSDQEEIVRFAKK